MVGVEDEAILLGFVDDLLLDDGVELGVDVVVVHLRDHDEKEDEEGPPDRGEAKGEGEGAEAGTQCTRV